MQSIAALLFFLQSEKTPVIDGAIAAVLLAFSVVVGVALERLLTKEAWKIAEKDGGSHREVLYWLVLIVGITLAIRFLAGSYVHLHMTYYKEVPTLGNYFCLLKDLVFLFAFGSFLVRMSLSDTSKEFLTWILVFSYADVLWCVIELMIRHGTPGAKMASGWLVIGLVQLVIVAICRKSLVEQKAGSPSSSKNFHIFIFLAIVALVIFGTDLWMILIGSGWTVFQSHPC